MADEPEFTAEEAVVAAQTMRNELGLSAEKFPLSSFVGLVEAAHQQTREVLSRPRGRRPCSSCR